MPASNPPTDILLLGATGFTGALCARYLAAHRDRSNFTVSLAARSKSKLDKLIAKLNLDTSTFNFKSVIVDVTDPEQVEQVVQGHSVVINTVGPFRLYGTPVVASCAKHGVHYVDLTGETTWNKEIITNFDFEASKTGAIIVPACGFDSIPSDIAAYLGAKTLHPRSVDTCITSVRLKGGFSGGTFATMLDAIENVPKNDLRASMKDWYLSPIKGIPSPKPRLLYSLADPETNRTYKGAIWLMAAVNKQVVQRTCGLLGLEARQRPEEGQLVYGPEFRYEEFAQMPGVITAAMFSAGFGFAAMCLLFVPPARWLLKRLAPSGYGPSDENMEKGFFKTTTITTSVPNSLGDVTTAKTIVSGKGDPGYLLTAIMICESALLLVPAAKPKERLPAIGRRGGILTAMSAFGDRLIDSLRSTGRFEFETKIVENKKTK